MPTQKLSPEIIAAAIAGFEAQKVRADEQIAELRSMLSGGGTKSSTPTTSTTTTTPTKRRKMSAAGRKAISEATKKRWAAFHAAKEAGLAGGTKRPGRKSAKKAGRKKAAETEK